LIFSVSLMDGEFERLVARDAGSITHRGMGDGLFDGCRSRKESHRSWFDLQGLSPDAQF